MKIKPSTLSGGGRFDELSNRISNTESTLNNSINTVQSIANAAKTSAANAQSTANDGVNRANTAQNTANTANSVANAALPKTMVVNSESITTNDYALTAAANNPNLYNSLRFCVNNLDNKRISSHFLKKVNEIFTYNTDDMALFCNWDGHNSLLPDSNCMGILRIPSPDYRFAFCLGITNTLGLYVGWLKFEEKTIEWQAK